MSGFESREVADIIDVPERNFRYWATSKALIPEEDAVGRQGKRRKYSFKNIVEGAVIRDLVDLNISLPQAAAAVSRLQDRNFMSAKFCVLMISVDGKIEIVTEDDVKTKRAKRTKAIDLDRFPTEFFEDEYDERSAKLFIYLFARIVMRKSAVLVPVHRIRTEMEQRVRQR